MLYEELSKEQKKINEEVTNGQRDVKDYVSPSRFSPRFGPNNKEYTRSQRFWDWVADMHS